MQNAKNIWAERVNDLASGVLQEHAADVDVNGRWPEESIQALADAGFFGLTLPEQIGGAGQGPFVFGQVTRVIAQHCASTAMIYLMHTCGTLIIAQAKNFPERGDVLKEISAGRHLSTLAFSERGSRSHFWAPVSQATAVNGHHILTAEKSWVTSAGHADSYIVSTRSLESTEPTESTLYYVAKGTDGFLASGPWDGLGLRGNASAPMRLQKVRVSPASRLTDEKDGFNVMMSVVMPWFQLGNANVALGIAKAALAGTTSHLANAGFAHLGQRLSGLMNLRARLAQMQILVDVHEAFLDKVAHDIENPGPTTMLSVLESKAAAAEAALQVTDLAMKTCGGASFSKHLTIERNFRDARAGWVMAPTTDVLYDFIGKSLLGIPLL